MYSDPAEGEEQETWLGGSGMGVMVLRPATTLDVLVTSGGAPVAGARTWAEEETPFRPRTEDARTDDRGRARLEWIPEGAWTVHAEAPGAGRGSVRVAAPAAGPVAVALANRTLEVEVAEEGTGTPVEGAGLFVWTRRHDGTEETWDEEWPPPAIPPTDSAGRTRILGRGFEPLRLAAVLPGEREARADAPRVDVAPDSVHARVTLRRARTVRWEVRDGERPRPAEGAEVRVAEARLFSHPFFAEALAGEDDLASWGARRGRIDGRDLVVDGLDGREVRLVARSPDGSLALLRAAAGAGRGEPTRFLLPRRLEVVVRDEDGRPVTDFAAVLKDADGEPLASSNPPDRDGRIAFETLPATEAAVCVLARWDLGGGEALRVDLAGGDREAEVVVGRPFSVVVRVRVDGKPRLPAEHRLLRLLPGPGRGPLGVEEVVFDAAEDATKGEVRFAVRPLVPGGTVTLELRVPGRDPLRREAVPPPGGGEAVVEFDL
jgi:hypothetical protein